MQTVEHSRWKSQLLASCREAFPEADAIMLWGGSTTADFDEAQADVDVIIEIDAPIRGELELAERLKTFVQVTSLCRLDPFIYLTGSSPSEPLEFIAPFGFYKANAFIPYLIKTQHDVLMGESRLLTRLSNTSLSEALLAYLPQVLSSLRRLRMDAEIETHLEPIVGKHRAPLFVVLRTVYAFERGEVGSKKAALDHLSKNFPKYRPIAGELSRGLGRTGQDAENTELTPALILSFAQDMVEALQKAHRRETAR